MKRLLPFAFVLAIFGAGCNFNPSDTPAPQKPAPAEEGATENTILDLSERGLTAIPSDVFAKTTLERLDLSNNQLIGAPQSQIQKLIKLKELNLSGNNLTGLPAELGQLKQLETLNVSNNELTGLPMEIGNLTQLRVFDISGNPFSARDLDEIAGKLPNTEIRR
jgi:Leucine-rich repeat (LRR) protein